MRSARRGSGPVLVVLSLAAGAPLLFVTGEVANLYNLLASTVLAYLAGVTAVRAATRVTGQARAAWILLSVAAVGWGLGNTYWTINELVVKADVLFPSPADLGFLTFPAAGAGGLWLLASGSSLGTRLTSLLDGLVITGSLLTMAWLTGLFDSYTVVSESWFGLSIALAYPAGDLVLVAMVLLLARRIRRGGRTVITLLVISALGMMLADILFAVASARGTYHAQGSAVSDAGWVVGFAALAAAGLHAGQKPLILDDERRPGRWHLLLPYAPFAVCIGVTAVVANRQKLDVVQIVTLLVVLALVMTRQFVTLLDNLTLTDQLRHQAFHDPLTGLANRALFTDRLQHALAVHARGGTDVVVLYIDLDDFKVTNDSQGHDAGDELLRGVAERLRACFRPADTIARLGGDEFAVIIEQPGRPEVHAQRALASMQSPFMVRSRRIESTVSIGVAGLGPDAAGRPTAEVLLKQVDLALYAAKEKGKNTYAVFHPLMWEHFDEEMTLRRELAEALDAGRLTVVYQPIHELAGGRVVGVEALARWNDDALGEVPPGRFIPVAERYNLIASIGDFVLERACRQFQAWNDGADHYLSVNVSPLQLLDPRFPDTVAAALQNSSLRASQLVLEVTETVLAEESLIAPALVRLRDLGVRIAIDDFGTGYSSLRYLQQFPVDIIKIDQSYVTHVADDPESAKLLSILLHMVTTLDLVCIIEGVERDDQAAALADLGCRFAQGFLFSRPMPPDRLPAVEPAVEATVDVPVSP